MAKKKKKSPPVPRIPPDCPFFIESLDQVAFAWHHRKQDRMFIHLELWRPETLSKDERLAIGGIACLYWIRAARRTRSTLVRREIRNIRNEWKAWSGD
jgi:hypothetical protein